MTQRRRRSPRSARVSWESEGGRRSARARRAAGLARPRFKTTPTPVPTPPSGGQWVRYRRAPPPPPPTLPQAALACFTNLAAAAAPAAAAAARRPKKLPTRDGRAHGGAGGRRPPPHPAPPPQGAERAPVWGALAVLPPRPTPAPARDMMRRHVGGGAGAGGGGGQPQLRGLPVGGGGWGPPCGHSRRGRCDGGARVQPAGRGRSAGGSGPPSCGARRHGHAAVGSAPPTWQREGPRGGVPQDARRGGVQPKCDAQGRPRARSGGFFPASRAPSSGGRPPPARGRAAPRVNGGGGVVGKRGSPRPWARALAKWAPNTPLAGLVAGAAPGGAWEGQSSCDEARLAPPPAGLACAAARAIGCFPEHRGPPSTRPPVAAEAASGKRGPLGGARGVGDSRLWGHPERRWRRLVSASVCCTGHGPHKQKRLYECFRPEMCRSTECMESSLARAWPPGRRWRYLCGMGDILLARLSNHCESVLATPVLGTGNGSLHSQVTLGMKAATAFILNRIHV